MHARRERMLEEAVIFHPGRIGSGTVEVCVRPDEALAFRRPRVDNYRLDPLDR
jgi:hypothetical protein